MFSKKNCIIAFLLCICFCFSVFACQTVYAKTVSELKQEQKNVDNKINKTENKIKESETKKRSYIAQLDTVEQNLAAVAEQIRQIKEKLQIANDNLIKQQKELKIIEERLAKSQKKAQDRVEKIYVDGEISYLDVIFNSTSVSDFLSNFVFLEKIVDRDKQIIISIKEDQQKARDKEAQLLETKNSIENLKTQKENQRINLLAKQEEKKYLIHKMETDKDAAIEALAELEALSNQIAKDIAKKQAASNKPSYIPSGGKLGWPVSGYSRISSAYGSRIHPITGRRSTHTGVDIPAPSGTAVLCAGAGEVIHVGSLSAYGNTIIVDHGGGLSTVYCHLSSYRVSVGSNVSRGQTIGGVGNTGWSTGPHLHFEVRINGNHVNPLKYIR